MVSLHSSRTNDADGRSPWIVVLGLIGAIALFLTWISPAWAIAVQDIPDPRPHQSWISDTADLLPEAAETELNQTLGSLATDEGVELLVVTVPTTKPAQSSEAFAIDLFDTWHIGEAATKQGVLFLVSKRQHLVEIEEGRGKVPPPRKVLVRNQEGQDRSITIKTSQGPAVRNLIKDTVIPTFTGEAYEADTLVNMVKELVVIESRPPIPYGPPHPPIPSELPNPSLATKLAQNPGWIALQQQPPWEFLLVGGAIATLLIQLLIRESRSPIEVPAVGRSQIDHADINTLWETWRVNIWDLWEKPNEGEWLVIHLTALTLSLSLTLTILALLWQIGGESTNPVIAGVMAVMFWVPLRHWGIHGWFAYCDRPRRQNGPYHCAECGAPLRTVSDRQMKEYLSPEEQAVVELKSMEWLGRYCPQCYPQLRSPYFTDPLPASPQGDPPESPDPNKPQTDAEPLLHPRPFHLFVLDYSQSPLKPCPNCHQKSATLEEEVLEWPTTSKEGLKQVWVDCQLCGHQHTKKLDIPTLTTD